MKKKFEDFITIVIPDIPPSVNAATRAFQSNSGIGFYKDNKLKAWEKLVKDICLIERPHINDAPTYGIELTFTYPKYYKNGNLKKKDLDNLIKYTIDNVVKYIITPSTVGLDDSRIDEVGACRIDSPQAETTITLYTIGNQDG